MPPEASPFSREEKEKSHRYAAVLPTENKLFWTNQTLLKTL